ncbi:MAG: glycerate kinase type-2 family protein [Candidatus Asgardarchaeia archaeon]
MSYIKNYTDLVSENRERAKVLDAIEYALRIADPYNTIIRSLSYNKKDKLLKIRNEIFSLADFESIYLLSFGKASIAMAEGIYEKLGSVINKGIIVSPFHRSNKLPASFEIIVAGHPDPNEKSITAAERIEDFISHEISNKDLLIVLISGGGSALIFKPLPPIELSEYVSLNKALLRSGASIREINIVRKHLSVFGGGKLISKANAKFVISLIISDVVGDDLSTIASGPTSPDPSTFDDVKRILTRYRLFNNISSSIKQIIEEGLSCKRNETLKPNDPIFQKVKNILLLKNLDILQSLKNYFEKKKIHAIVLTSRLVGEAREIGNFLYYLAEDTYLNGVLGEPPLAILLGGETTVTVKGSGTGGRNQELVLSFLNEMDPYIPVIISSFGTDGIDGPTDAAGAICDCLTKRKAMELNFNLQDYLSNNDSYTALKQLNSLIYTGYTGTNVNDIVIILISKNSKMCKEKH